MIAAAQDQAINTIYFKHKNLKEEMESECRLWKDTISSCWPLNLRMLHFGEE
jgi:hypothetical protein